MRGTGAAALNLPAHRRNRMTQFSVLLGMALLFSIAALSVDGSGVKDPPSWQATRRC